MAKSEIFLALSAPLAMNNHKSQSIQNFINPSYLLS